MQQKILSVFPALKYKNYRLYFFSQLISLIGTWLQIVAQSWLVLELTNSAFWVGTVSAIGFLPVLLFALIGGVIVDRFQTKSILIFTNILAMLLALTLGTLALFGILNLWILCILAFLLGIVNALDMPARQSFTIELVEKHHLPSAISLNMGMFNSSRVIGPALAGLLIQKFGNGGAFILNGLSFIAPVIALTLMKVHTILPTEHPNPFESIKQGIKYTASHKLIRSIILFAAVFSIFGFSYNTILPVVVKDIFHRDASGLSAFYTAAGLGALTGVVLITFATKKFSELQLILFGSIICSLSLFAFSLTNNFTIALATLYINGAAMTFPFAMLMSTLQHHVDNNVRGRVMSIFTLAFLGMQPLGSFQIGTVAEHFTPALAFQINSVVVLLAAIMLYLSLSIREKSS